MKPGRRVHMQTHLCLTTSGSLHHLGHIPYGLGPQGLRQLALAARTRWPLGPDTPCSVWPVYLQHCPINLDAHHLSSHGGLCAHPSYSSRPPASPRRAGCPSLCILSLGHSVFHEVSCKNYVKVIYVFVGKGLVLFTLGSPALNAVCGTFLVFSK